MLKTFAVALALSAAMLVAPASADSSKDGLDAFNRGDFAAALRVMRPLAEEGDVVAMVTIGTMYEHGFGVRQDVVEAVRWYQRAADRNVSETSLRDTAGDKRLIAKH